MVEFGANAPPCWPCGPVDRNAVAGVTDIAAGASTSIVAVRCVVPRPLVVLLNDRLALCVPTASASAPAVKATVTMAMPPAGMVPLAGVADAHDGSPVTVKFIGSAPVFCTV